MPLTFKQELILLSWWFFYKERYDLYHQGLDIGMASKYAFERAQQHK